MEQPAHHSYKDKETFDLQLLLGKNQYTNLNSLHICFPITFRKLTNAAVALENMLAPVNNFFEHWLKKVNVTKYGMNRQLIPTSTPQKIYQHSVAMLKYLPDKNLKNIRKHFLFSEKVVIYTTGVDRRPNNDNDDDKRSDGNIDD